VAGGAHAGNRGADGRFEKRESSHFVLLQDVDIDETGGLRGSRRFEQQVLAALESGHEQLDEYLGLRPRRKIQVMVYDPLVFQREFAGLFRFPAAGFYQGVIRVRGDDRFTEPLSRVLHHELVHAALDLGAPSLVLPAWVNEGLAEWFEARTHGKRRLDTREWLVLADARERGQLLPFAALEAPSFVGMARATAQLAYLQSYGVMEYLARRHGERSLREFCLELLRTGDIDRTLTRVYRIDRPGLAAGFAADLG